MKNNKEYLDKVVGILDKPYFYELENYGIKDYEEKEYVLRKIYGFDIRFITNYHQGSDIYNSIGNQIYYEDSNGWWYKKEFDENGDGIYYEDSDGLTYGNMGYYITRFIDRLYEK